MGRKTTKSILSRDEISLLLNSEETKNIKLYGNLYSVLCELQNLKAVTLEQLQNIDNKAKAALTYNKKTLIDTVIKEWYAERVSEEDPTQKIRCGLCNTPNKYLYYIRNRKNNTLLNVGSHCITKFPGIEGYIAQKKQLSQIHKGHQIIKRRNEFYDNFPDCETFISDADKYFNALPILLPYELYIKLQDTITCMRLIYTRYVNEGKKPFKSEMDSFELFSLTVEQYNKLKLQADIFVLQNENAFLMCKRREINWMISNNKDNLLKQIAENGGKYQLCTIQKVYCADFIKDNLHLFIERNRSSLLKIEKMNDSNFVFSFNKFGYQPSILFDVNLKDFMQHIGANCIINNDFTYGSKEILSISTIINSKGNLISIIEYIDNMMNLLNSVFLMDDTSNSLYLCRKGDRAVRQFSYYSFMKNYSKYILLSNEEIKKYLISIVNGNGNIKWISTEMQSKQGIDDKIGILYKAYKESHEYNIHPTGQLFELMTYSVYNNAVTGMTKIDFDSSEFITLQRNKLKMEDYQLRSVEYGLRINDESLSPYYHKEDILFIQTVQKIKTDAVLFFASTEKILIQNCHSDSEESESIFSFSSIPKKELVAYGRVIYCFHNKTEKKESNSLI